MAEQVLMKHKESGLMKKGFYGFSWTTLFFGAMPALFRGDFVTFLSVFAIAFILGLISMGIAIPIVAIIWAFQYNKYYTRKLLEKGYEFADTPENNRAAALAVGVALNDTAAQSA